MRQEHALNLAHFLQREIADASYELQGRIDREQAEAKLRQMYHHCEIVECHEQAVPRRIAANPAGGLWMGTINGEETPK